LMHLQPIDELYQASWRPTSVEAVPQFSHNVPAAPEAGESVRNNTDALVARTMLTPSKPAGAYRPPGARGLATPAIFKREDEGGAPRVPTNGAATPPRGYSRSPAPSCGTQNGGGLHQNGNGRDGNGGRRYVPGAAKSPSPIAEGDKKGNRKRKTGKDGSKRDGPVAVGGLEDICVDRADVSVGVGVDGEDDGGQQMLIPMSDTGSIPPTPGLDGTLDPIAKKVRNLNKKVGVFGSFCF
jgi:translation initiation factor 2A